jgi:AcrR family transcriptional regulator
VKRVCTEAGLTERYFYESFDNMEDILCAAYVQITDALWVDLIEISQRAPAAPHDRIEAVLAAYFAAVRKNRNGARLVLLEIAGAGERGDAAYRTEMSRAADVVLRYFVPLLPEHPSNGLSPLLLVRGLMGAVYQLAREWLLANCRQPAQDLTRNALAIFDGVFAQWRG